MSFEIFYNSTFNGLYRYFYYRFASKHEAEDMAHETYIRFYHKYSSKNLSETEAKKILYGIAKNVLKESIRQSIKRNSIEFIDGYDYELDENDINEFEDNDFELKTKERQKLISKHIEGLSENIKQILKLKYFKSKSRREIAEIMGISEDMVHTYQKRGIKYLKKLTVPPVS